jgi:hypothetical protein
MLPFEKFVRDRAEENPGRPIAEILRLYDKQKDVPTFEIDPVAWAKEQPEIVSALQGGARIRAVVELRKRRSVDLHQAKTIVDQLKRELGL